MKLSVAVLGVLLAAGLPARSGELLALGSLASLGLEGGGEVVGRVVELSESHVHVVGAGTNRKIPFAALDAAARARLGVVLPSAPGVTEMVVARPGMEGGLAATRDRLREALERYEDAGWGVRPVRSWSYGYFGVPYGWGYGWPVVGPAPGCHRTHGGSSLHLQVKF